MDQGSVSEWIAAMKAGDEAAVAALWTRFSPDLLRAAQSRLNANVRRVSDEEDVALSAFVALWGGAAHGRLPLLRDRNGLWRLLITLVHRKALDHSRSHTCEKRGSGCVRGDSAFRLGGSGVSARPTIPDQAASESFVILKDEIDYFVGSLKEETLRQIASRKLEGATNHEIAASLHVSVRTVERKLKLIKAYWQVVAQC